MSDTEQTFQPTKSVGTTLAATATTGCSKPIHVETSGDVSYESTGCYTEITYEGTADDIAAIVDGSSVADIDLTGGLTKPESYSVTKNGSTISIAYIIEVTKTYTCEKGKGNLKVRCELVKVSTTTASSSSSEEDAGSGSSGDSDSEKEEEELSMVSYTVTSVENNIMNHPKASDMEAADGTDASQNALNEALRLYIAGHPMSEKISLGSGKGQVTIGSLVEGRWAAKKAALGITSYLDFVTTATIRTESNSYTAGSIVTSGKGLPALGGNRNWLVIGTGTEVGANGKKVTTVTLQSSAAGGWDAEIYGG